MSILSQLIAGKITFSQAASQAEAWAEKIIGQDPTLSSATGQLLSDVKQAASNAVQIADSDLDAVIGPLSATAETALEAALAAVTKGASLPFNVFVTDGIDTIAGALKAEADAWALRVKAGLTPSQTTQGPGQGGAPLATQVSSALSTTVSRPAP